MDGRGEQEDGGLKKGPTPGQQTLTQPARSGASGATEPGKNTLVPPTAAPAASTAAPTNGAAASTSNTSTAPSGAATAASGAEAAGTATPDAGVGAATGGAVGSGARAAVNGAAAAGVNASAGGQAAGAGAAASGAAGSSSETSKSSKDAASSASGGTAEAIAGAAATGAAGSSSEASKGANDAASAAGAAAGGDVAAGGSKDAATGGAPASTRDEKGAGAQGVAEAAPAGDAPAPASAAPKAAAAPPSGPPPARAEKGGGGHLATARATAPSASSDGASTAPAAGVPDAALQKKAAGSEAAAKAPPPAQPPPPAAKTTVAVGPSRSAQHAAEQIQAALAADQQALSTAASTKRSALQAAADAQAEQILAASGSQYTATISAIGERQQAAKMTFTQARAHVEVTRAAQGELARSDAKAAEKRLHDGNALFTTRVNEAAESESSRMKLTAQGTVDRCEAGAMKLASDIAGATINPRSLMSELTAGELVAIDHAVEEAKSQARGKLVWTRIEAQGKLGGTALDNASAIRDSADTVAGEIAKTTPKASDAIYKTADATVGLINHMAASQMSAIDKAEHATMSSLEHSKSDARSVHSAGQMAAADVRSKVVAQITALNNHEAAGSKGLAAMADEALAAINQKGQISHLEASHAIEATKTGLKTGCHQLLASLDETGGAALALINGSTEAYNSAVAGQRDKFLANVDAAISTAAGVLTQSNTEFDANCKTYRSIAVTTYVAAETQLFSATATEVAKVTADWKAKATEFVASCQDYENELFVKHGEVRGATKPQLESVARQTVSDMRRSKAQEILDGMKEGFGSFTKGLAIFIGAVLIVAVAIYAFVATITFAAALAIAAALVGAFMLGYGLTTSLITRFKQLWNNDWPWYAKIAGIPAAIGVAIGDVFGLSQIIEGLRKRELISERELSDKEAAAKITEGSLQLITLGVLKALSERGGGPKELPPGRGAGELPPGEGAGELPPGNNGRALPPGETPAPPPETTSAPEPVKPVDPTATGEPPKPAEPPKTAAPPATTPEPPKTAEPPATTPEPPKTAEPPATTPEPPKTSDPSKTPEPAKPADPAKTPEPAKPAESPFKAEALEKSKSFAKGEAKKQSDKFDLGNDPDAKGTIEQTWRDAFNKDYVRRREAGESPADAMHEAKKFANKEAVEAAKQRAGEPANLQRAREQARADRDAGKQFKDNLDAETKGAKDEYDKGTQGGEAKSLASKLDGKSVPEIQKVLDADAAAGKCTKTPGTSEGKPMDSYFYPDGTLVRVKPQGSKHSPNPMYSIEVTKQPGVSGTQDDVAFKVDRDGRATPKGPDDLKVPRIYDKNINPHQNKAYVDEAMKYGHQEAKPEPPKPPPDKK